MRDITVIIPAYKPDERLVALIQELRGEFPVLVVDDGGGTEFAGIFEQARSAGAVVLTHEENKGKGAALKSAYRYMLDKGTGSGAITADADGQHKMKDIIAVAEAMEANPDTFVVGGRDFRKMPPRSRFGNTVTRFVFRLATGLKISDTQTGLRGIPACSMEKMAAVTGDRYEYEINVLLSLKEWGLKYIEIPIETVYIDDNSSSHFHPVRDGLKVFGRVIKFAMSSLICTGIDYLLYCVLKIWLPVGWSYALARVVSASVNYQLSRRVVFHGKPSIWSFIGYFALAAACMLIGSFGVSWLTSLGVNSVVAKLIFDCSLFVMNYFVQKKIIFRNRED